MKKWKDRSKEEQDQIKCNVLLGIAAGVGLVAGVGGCLAVSKIADSAYKKKWDLRRIETSWRNDMDEIIIAIRDGSSKTGEDGKVRSAVGYSVEDAKDVIRGITEEIEKLEKSIESRKFNEAINDAVDKLEAK